MNSYCLNESLSPRKDPCGVENRVCVCGGGGGGGSLGLVRHRPSGEQPGVDLQLSVELQIE